MSNDTHNRLHSVLAEYGQEHLLAFYNRLDDVKKNSLIREIEALDLPLVRKLSESLLKSGNPNHSSDLLPLEATPADTYSEKERLELVQMGLELIKNGKVAVFLVAGGQGTRLGFNGPKGAFDLGLDSGKSLFELQAQRLKALSRKAGAPIPWYIMTSALNHKETVSYFNQHDNFDFQKQDLYFFQQEMLPAVSANGKILLESPGHLALSPNGNGGCFPALEKSGALEDMEKRGVEYVFFYVVDNALIKMADPFFIGFSAASHYPVTGKVVEKSDPREKVGLLALKDGKPAVIEYSDMPEEKMSLRETDGKLAFRAGNIAIHLFRLDFLKKHCRASLPYHRAYKKIPTIDTEGRPVKPESPNGFKFELFMFDLFPSANGMAALCVNREEEFSPVKNQTGNDSPETARQMLMAEFRRTGDINLI